MSAGAINLRFALRRSTAEAKRVLCGREPLPLLRRYRSKYLRPKLRGKFTSDDNLWGHRVNNRYLGSHHICRMTSIRLVDVNSFPFQPLH